MKEKETSGVKVASMPTGTMFVFSAICIFLCIMPVPPDFYQKMAEWLGVTINNIAHIHLVVKNIAIVILLMIMLREYEKKRVWDVLAKNIPMGSVLVKGETAFDIKVRLVFKDGKPHLIQRMD